MSTSRRFSAFGHRKPWLLGRLLLFVMTAIAALSLPVSAQQPTAQPLRNEADSTTTWALLIGVDGYQHVRPLVHCKDDVRLLRQTLRERGGLKDRHIFSLSEEDDTPLPTRENILQKLGEFLDKPGAGDSVLVFFSGHGFRDAAGKTYLAPIDCHPDRLQETAVPVATQRDHLQACRAAVKLLVIDACHAGGARGSAGGQARG